MNSKLFFKRVDGDAPPGLPMALMVLMACLALSGSGCVRPDMRVHRVDNTVTIETTAGEVATRYHLRPPADSSLSVRSGGFFHPLTSPAGVGITDLAPADHKHHRGVFLAFVEMHGEKDADFWGWGEPAPIQDRQILNQSFHSSIRPGWARLGAVNLWKAEDAVLLVEKMDATTEERRGVRLLDLVYELTPRSDLTLSQWAFSGFCVRMRKDGAVRMESPYGEITLPDPIHTKPESDWPDAAWYACELDIPGVGLVGVAVINHPSNPPTRWHNHRTTRMLNPCVVAPGALILSRDRPLMLRYRVVTFDGKVPRATLDRLSGEWRADQSH